MYIGLSLQARRISQDVISFGQGRLPIRARGKLGWDALRWSGHGADGDMHPQEKVKTIVSTTSHPDTPDGDGNTDAPVFNPYHTNPPNFKELGEQYPSFKPL
jgi:hypothetical protein